MSFLDNLGSKIGLGRNYDEQAFAQFPESMRRGRGSASDPQSLDYNQNAPGALSRTWAAVSGWLHGERHMPFDPHVNASANAAESWKFWKDKGLPDSTVAELLGNEQGESGMNPTQRGDNGAAGGIFQWHKERRDKILGATGIDVWQDQNHQHQLEAAYREMKDGIDAGAGRAWDKLTLPHVLGSGVATLVDDNERPADPTGDKAKRLAYAGEYYKMFHDGQAASATPTPTPLGASTSDDDAQAAKSQRMKLEIIHRNAPIGSSVSMDTSDAPGVTVMPVKTVQSMPMGGSSSGY